MIVTVNTDASFHHEYKVGAFAFWIVCNQGKIMHSGELKEAKDPTDAEIRCIANALHALLNSRFTGVTKVIINSDALHAFDRCGRSAQAGSPGRKVHNILQSLKDRHSVSGRPIHEFRHVKAHSGTAEKRKWVNNWCDKAAKKMLWEKINRQNSDSSLISSP